MPLLSQDQMIKMYWEKIRNQYPDLTFIDVERICKAPFNFAKDTIASAQGDHIPIVRIKHLGEFRIFVRSIATMKYYFNRALYRGDIGNYTWRENIERLENWKEMLIAYDNSKKTNRNEYTSGTNNDINQEEASN